MRTNCVEVRAQVELMYRIGKTKQKLQASTSAVVLRRIETLPFKTDKFIQAY